MKKGSKNSPEVSRDHVLCCNPFIKPVESGTAKNKKRDEIPSDRAEAA
jgi:hypothetical protein